MADDHNPSSQAVPFLDNMLSIMGQNKNKDIEQGIAGGFSINKAVVLRHLLDAIGHVVTFPSDFPAR